MMRSDSLSRPVSFLPPRHQATVFSPARLSVLLEALLTRFIGNQQPQIRMGCDRDGQLEWRVWDPVSQQRHVFDTEEDLRIWLEQRYYQ